MVLTPLQLSAMSKVQQQLEETAVEQLVWGQVYLAPVAYQKLLAHADKFGVKFNNLSIQYLLTSLTHQYEIFYTSRIHPS